MSDDERGKKRKVPPSPRYAVHCAPTPVQRLHSSLRARVESRKRALQALGLSDDEGVLDDVCAWPLDRVRPRTALRKSEGWNKAGRRKRRWGKREKVERGGWCPEGSFEFEWESPAADALRKRKAAVSRLLRRVGAVARPTPVTPPATASPPQSARPESPKKSPPKTPKKSPSTPTSNPGKGGKADGEDEEKEQGLGSPKKGKKKKKKKKKATLANEGNPHHIDKYRPSRLPSYSWHTSVLFPPSLRFLAARNRFPVRENEYICFPCEVALYYSSESSRRRAVSARFKTLARFDPRLRRRRRKGRCTAPRGDGGEEYDEEYDDEEYEEGDEEDAEGGEGDDGHWTQAGGRCTCCLEPP